MYIAEPLMISAKALLKLFGYRDLRPLAARGAGLRVTEAAFWEDLPRVALATWIRGGRRDVDSLQIPSLSASVTHALIGGKSPGIYRRAEGDVFERDWRIPKAGGRPWGTHTRGDLVPIRSLDEMLKMGRRVLAAPHAGTALAHVLALKVLDETQSGQLSFRFKADGERNVLNVLGDLAQKAGTGGEWCECRDRFGTGIEHLALAWEPYAFLPWIQTHGVFGDLLDVLSASAPGTQILSPPVVRLVKEFLAGCREPVAIAGEGACGLLDLGLLHAKRCVRVCQHCPSPVVALANCLVPGFEVVSRDFLMLEGNGRWPSMVCVPPVGMASVDPAVAERSTLLRELGPTRSRVPAEPIWLEKCHSLLVDGGILCAVLPEGALSNASLVEPRRWLLERFRLRAVVELPPGGMIRTGIKLSLVVMVKTAQPPRDYPVLMGVVKLDDPADCREIIDAYRCATEEAAP